MDDDEQANLIVYGSPQVPPQRGLRPMLAVPATIPPLILRPARLPDPEDIPPRQWLLGNLLLRGFVTVMVAPGGTGKSIWAMTAALSLAIDKPLLGMKVWQQVNAAIINEDPIEELERRLAAILKRHEIGAGLVEERYFLNSMDERVLIVAARDVDGFDVIYPDEEALVEQILAHHIGLIVVDPYAESHLLEENSNPDMLKAAAAWRRIARRTNCAVLLVHHVRKGADGAGIDAARGAKGLTDSARVGLVMQVMTEDEAEKAGVEKDHRLSYVRVDSAKSNLAPRMDRANWFHLETVSLGNGNATYEHGDNVAAMVPWKLPGLFDEQSSSSINEVLDAIHRGPEEGILYSATKRGKSDRWGGCVVADMLDVPEEKAKEMLKSWLKSGLLELVDFKHPEFRRMMPGLAVNNARRPG